MSQMRLYTVDSHVLADTDSFDTIILDDQLIDELDEEGLQDDDIRLNGLTEWSCGEIFAHDFLPGSSRSVGFLSGIDLDAKVSATIDSVVSSHVPPTEEGEGDLCVSFDSDFAGLKGAPVKRPARKKATIVQCEYCGVVLKHPSKIQAHMRTHTGEKPFECFMCGMRFTQRTPMRMHVRRHLNETPFVCTFGCGKSFVSNALKNAHELKAHLKEQRRGPPRPHLKPPRKSISMFSSTSPTFDETPEMVFPRHLANEGSKEFTSAANEKLDEVINAVAAGIPLDPPKKVRRRSAIVAECGECGLILKHPSKIKAHMRIHTGERPFECQFCGMRFATANPLRVHLRRAHTGEKPFECTWECGRRFVSISARNEHERVVHAGLKRYQCAIGSCRRLFTRRHYLVIHQAKDHNIEDCNYNMAARCTAYTRRKQNANERISDAEISFALPGSSRHKRKKSDGGFETVHVNLDGDDDCGDAQSSLESEEIDSGKSFAGIVTKVGNDEAVVWIADKKVEAFLELKKVPYAVEIGDWLEVISLSGNHITEFGQIRPSLEDEVFGIGSNACQPITNDDAAARFDSISTDNDDEMVEGDVESDEKPHNGAVGYSLPGSLLEHDPDDMFFEEMPNEFQTIQPLVLNHDQSGDGGIDGIGSCMEGSHELSQLPSNSSGSSSGLKLNQIRLFKIQKNFSFRKNSVS